MSDEAATMDAPLPDAWTIGTGRLGNPPKPMHDQPQHYLRITRTSSEIFPDHFSTADEAIKSRIKRLREAGTKYRRDGMTLRYSDRDGDVELTYEVPGDH